MADDVTPPTPLEAAQSRLAAYLAAELRILRAQQYQVGDGATARMLRNAELETVRKGIAECKAEIASLTPGRYGVSYLR